MSKDSAGAARAPIYGKGIKERIILQSELRRLDGQLQNFSSVRDRMVASGQDANAEYREILSRRDQVISELKKLRPAAIPPADAGASDGPPPRGSLLSLPIAPARLGTGLGPWFGYAGSVQMGPAQEGDNEMPHNGNFSGTIYTYHLDSAGRIVFTGDCDAEDLPSKTDGYPPFLWFHSWRYLVPFPPAVVRSIFTYSFDVGAQAYTGMVSGSGVLASYILLGEAPAYQGQEILLDIDGGRPFVCYIQLAAGPFVEGSLQVQRSFVVEAGSFPAVAVALGILCNEDPHTQVGFDVTGNSYIMPSSGGVEGRVNFRYDPIIVAHP